MDVLIRYGFSIDEIKHMMDTNQDIGSIPDNDIYALIDILGNVGCMSNHIKNIFLCNPFYLNRSVEDINILIGKLKEIGLTNLNILFDTNPYILNLTDKDIDKIYKDKIKNGMKKSEVIEFFNYDCNSIL